MDFWFVLCGMSTMPADSPLKYDMIKTSLTKRQLPDNTNKNLYICPIIHTTVDQGTLQNDIQTILQKKHTAKELIKKNEIIQQYWKNIAETVMSLPLDFTLTKLYQDSLPICGKEKFIVKDLSENGSINHTLLLKLMGRGATLIGTESPDLLLEEYQLATSLLKQERNLQAVVTETIKQKSTALLNRRDEFIAKRIQSTLFENENGILFIGLLHDVERYFDRTIRIHQVFNLNQ